MATPSAVSEKRNLGIIVDHELKLTTHANSVPSFALKSLKSPADAQKYL